MSAEAVDEWDDQLPLSAADETARRFCVNDNNVNIVTGLHHNEIIAQL